MKKICFVILALLIFTISVVNANPDVTITVNGQKVIFVDTQPFVENDRTFVPIRAISEMMEYDVLWDEETETVTIKNNDDEMKLVIGKDTYTVNGDEKQMDVAPFIKDDRTVVPLRFVAEGFGCDVDWIDDTQTVVINKYKNVTVSTAEELLESIDDCTVISLNEGEYNLSKVDSVDNLKVEKSEVFDGYEFIIAPVKNLVIQPVEGAEVSVVVEPRYANVFLFMSSENITIKGITAGHTVEKGQCAGGVIMLVNCNNADIENCNLYGCGTYGIISQSSNGITVNCTEIYECTNGAIDLYGCKDVKFNNCIFRDCSGFSILGMINCVNAEIKDSVIKDNETEWSSFISADGSDLKFTDCKFENNKYSEIFCDNDEVVFDNCDIQ